MAFDYNVGKILKKNKFMEITLYATILLLWLFCIFFGAAAHKIIRTCKVGHK